MTKQHDFTGGDEDYMEHVLYVIPGDRHCDKVIAAINRMQLDSNVVVNDVSQSKPQWLRGVPTLVSNTSSRKKVIERVNNVMNHLVEIRKSELNNVGYSNMASTGASPMGGVSLFEEGVFSCEGDPPQKLQRDNIQETTTTVEDLRNQREAMDRRIMANMSTKPSHRGGW